MTRWSKLENAWEGVAFRTIIERARTRPEARFVMFHCEAGYTANLPIEVMDDEEVLFAMKHGGETLTPDYGYPQRAAVPKRYSWKSANWIRSVEFMADDRLGFWERHGYRISADFTKEERFS